MSRCQVNRARIRQSRPESGLGFQVTVLDTFELLPLHSKAAGTKRAWSSQPRLVREAYKRLDHQSLSLSLSLSRYLVLALSLSLAISLSLALSLSLGLCADTVRLSHHCGYTY